MESLIDSSKTTTHIAVFGDVMVDTYWQGSAQRISPEAPVPVLGVTTTRSVAGGAANVAQNCAALGAVVSLCGVVGHDQAYAALNTVLQASGIQWQPIHSPARTIEKVRCMAHQQQLLRVDFEDPIPDTSKQQLQIFAKMLNQVTTLVLSDYGKGTLQDCQPLIQLARAHKIPVLVDPKGSNIEKYRGATMLTPNLNEFECIVGVCANNAIIEKTARELCQQYDIEYMLVTRGAQGITLVNNTTAIHIPTMAREVYDVTGAGDTVIATVATMLSRGESVAESVRIANVAAGLVVEKIGTAQVSANELMHALQPETTNAALPLSTLLHQVQRAQSQHKRIIFTNGCFDILHAGHVAYLQQAKSLGDKLIVALNDDQSVTRLKGKDRPINPIEQRLQIIAALGCVDWVIPFSQDTPAQLLTCIKPDILVKGGDYSATDEIVGRQIVEAYGGEVSLLCLQPSISTTHIIQTIQAKNT